MNNPSTTKATHTVGLAGATLLVAALLLPVGDAPWFSFWREWTVSAALLLIVLDALNTLRDLGLQLCLPSVSLPAAALVLAALVWVQHVAGQVPLLSDALLPALYLMGFALCGIATASLPQAQRDEMADRLAFAMLTAALLSTPWAVLQWLGRATLDLGIPVSGGRPVAHMEQANLLCSLTIQGSFAAWRLAERRRLGWPAALAVVCPMLSVTMLTQSRVSWLVGAVLVCVVVLRRDVLSSRRQRRGAVALVLAVVIGTLLLPWFDAHFGIAGAALSERMSGGRRPVVWAMFLEGAWSRRWLGWGALQSGAAQYAMADGYPSAGWFFSSAHNIVIDLMLWFGLPIGLLVSAALAWAVLRRIRHAPDTAALATALAAAALVLHALVEFPLQYTYFLFPLGILLAVGAPQADDANVSSLRVSAGTVGLLPALSLAPALALALLASDYIRVTDVRPVLELDLATRHSLLSAQPPVPAVVLLDQLQAFHAFAALPLQTGTSAADLEAARLAMLRSPFAPSIERFALLAGINGGEAASTDALRHLCKFEPSASCEESQRVWAFWRLRWPQIPPWPRAQQRSSSP